MLKDIILFIKYPYTAGVIGTMWLGSAILMALNSGLNGVDVVIINLLATIVLAAVGFSGREG